MHKILIIDDNAMLVDALAESLNSQYQVTTSICPSAALQILQTEDFDIIICDLNMPLMSGTEFFNHLSKFNPNLLERAILLTGNPEDSILAKLSTKVRICDKLIRSKELIFTIETIISDTAKSSSVLKVS